MSESSPLARWLLLAAGGLAVITVFWLSAGPPTTEPNEARRGPGEGASGGHLGWDPTGAPALPEATGPQPTRAGVADEGDALPVPADSLRVRVLDASSREPVVGARVWLLAETAESLAQGWASFADLLTPDPVLTDAQGRALLSWGEGEAARRVVADAPGRRAAEARANAPGQRLVLALEAGLGIQARVEDAQGRPLSRVAVVAEAARRPRPQGAAPPAALVPMRGAEAVRGESDADGVVAFEGLTAGYYLLRPVSPGYVALRDLPPSTSDPLPGVEGVLAEAGQRDVRLVLARVGTLAIHVVEGEDGPSVNAPWVSVTTLPSGRGTPRTFASYATSPPASAVASEGEPSPATKSSEAADPAQFRVWVPLDAGASEERMDVEVRAPGYEPARATVRLVLSDGGGPAAPLERVALRRSGPGGNARLKLDCRRTLPGVVRPAARVLSLCRLEDGVRATRRASSSSGDVAEFTGLPAGAAWVEVYDGLSRSLPLQVILTDGATVEGRVEFAPLSGVRILLLDAAGQRVYDADVLVFAPAGRERGLPDCSWATRHASGAAHVVALEPGRYRYAVSKRGVGYDAGVIDVAAGMVAQVTARLGPLRRFFDDATAGKR